MLTAWTFDATGRADEAGRALASVEGVRTWAVVVWSRRRYAPRISAADPGADLWHLLLGLAFLTPLAGPRSTSAMQPAPTWDFLGVRVGFVNALRDHLAPSSSQLVALVDREAEGAADTVVHEFEPVHRTRADVPADLLGPIDELYLADCP